MSKRTNELAKAANLTNEALAAQVRRRDEEADALRDRERNLLLAYLAYPLGAASAAMDGARRVLDVPEGHKQLREDQAARDAFAAVVEGGIFALPESVRGRIHFLDLRLASQVLRIEAALPVFVRIVKVLDAADAELGRKALESLEMGTRIAKDEVSQALAICQTAARNTGIAWATRDVDANAVEGASSSDAH